MADAANILLNLTRNPYRVQPQPNLFRGRATPDTFGKATRDISSTIAMVQQAKQLADAIAPFLAKEYQPPGQQAAQTAQANMQTAQQAAQTAQADLQQAQQTQQAEKFGGLMGLKQAFTPQAQAQPTDAQVDQLLRANEMLQQASTPAQVDAVRQAYQVSQAGQQPAPTPTYDVTDKAMPEWQKQQLAQQAQQEAARQQAAQQYRANLQGDVVDAQDAVQDTAAAAKAAQEAAAKAGPILPTFETIADAETAIKAALVKGDFKAVQDMIQGLQYSRLADVRAKDLMESLRPELPRQRAIADLMKRLGISRFQAVAEQAKGRVAAGERQKGMIQARKDAAKLAFDREKMLLGERGAEQRKTQKDRHDKMMLEIKARNKGALRAARARNYGMIKRAKVTATGQLAVEVQRGLNKAKGKSNPRRFLQEFLTKRALKLNGEIAGAKQYLASTENLNLPPTDQKESTKKYYETLRLREKSKKLQEQYEKEDLFVMAALEYMQKNPGKLPTVEIFRRLKEQIDSKQKNNQGRKETQTPANLSAGATLTQGAEDMTRVLSGMPKR